jgi:peptide deformylase
VSIKKRLVDIIRHHFFSKAENRGFDMRINYTTIIKDNDPTLRDKSVLVPVPMLKKDIALGKSLMRYVRDSRDEDKAEKYNLKAAVGIAAPQIGAHRSIICVMVDEEVGDEVITYELLLANPKIISQSVQKAALKTGEGCLSVIGQHQGYVYRSARIKVRAIDVFSQEEIEFRAHGYLAIVLQHEIDHLNGILFYDRINQENPWEIKENAIIIE